MPKKKRIKYEDIGGGSSSLWFDGKLFEVWVGHHSIGPTTHILCKHSNVEIWFDKRHTDLDSDAKCLEQVRPSEILKMFEDVAKKAFYDGKQAKLKEIQKMLGIRYVK